MLIYLTVQSIISRGTQIG